MPEIIINALIPLVVVLTPIAIITFGSAWVHRRSKRPHGRVIAFLEKCRRAAAYE